MNGNFNFHDSILGKYSKSGTPVKNLRRFASLCIELGISPERLRESIKFIHIAGTNGKGSVSEYISAALAESGCRTGKFTSPYIVRINERIQINNEPIGDNDLSRFTELADNAALKCGKVYGNFSQFEILTAAMLLYFSENNVDCAVIETGIGGLLDCTNLIIPEISVITAVDYDHSEILGITLSEIAAHKAGIIKKNIPCVLYPEQDGEALRVITEKADYEQSALHIPDLKNLNVLECSVFGNTFSYDGTAYNTAMGGRHQILNALTSIEALHLLGIEKKFTVSALGKAVLPARMQVVKKEPPVIIDGAHNPHGLKACRELLGGVPRRKTLLIGMMNGKDCRRALEEILPLCGKDGEVIFCDGFSENAADCGFLYETAVSLGFPLEHIRIISECVEAFSYAVKKAEELDGLLLVTGSLYLAGFILGNMDLSFR